MTDTGPEPRFDVIVVEKGERQFRPCIVEAGYQPSMFAGQRQVTLRDLPSDWADLICEALTAGLIIRGMCDPSPPGPRLIVDNTEGE
jgi:hypothetical protein